uniref:ornithine decarboxylase n=1 Tax=Gadus morhua TaxID=8049 RepID=A0A8C5BUG8_GADMO
KYIKHLRWARALPRVTPFYAVKCSNSISVVRTLASLGCGFDCASKSLGVAPSRIIYANPCKQASQIKYASAHGVQKMTFDIMGSLRLQLVCPLSVKFGATLKGCRGLLQRAKELSLDVIGVSFHVGSMCRDPATYTQAISDARCVFNMAEFGYKMSLLDIGGGFPVFPCISLVSDETNEKTMMYYVNDGVYGSFSCILYDHAEYFVDCLFYVFCILYFLFENMGAYTVASILRKKTACMILYFLIMCKLRSRSLEKKNGMYDTLFPDHV